MLFNSYVFLFVFLPVALIGYEVAGRFDRRAVVAWLGLASLAFYTYWRPIMVLLLIGSILFNYLAASLISKQIPNKISSTMWMWLAIAINLATLGFFKYFFPFLNFVSTTGGLNRHWAEVVLPLGISFFTFTQIAYLIDLEQGAAQPEDLSSYVCFVTFFPHLIAGPILHHKDMMPQFRQDRVYRLRMDDVTIGFSWFVMGLGKKVLLADTFAKTAILFYSADKPFGMLLTWRGLLGYGLQLYFDFSGYSDMALGLARMFSIDFPLNFSSPYKAVNIIDYWQRWHITLTNYITAYIYTPLQKSISAWRMERGMKVSRKAQATLGGFSSMVAFPMLFTLFIAGLWHGAGVQFMLYGLIHGAYLTINHAWKIFGPKTTAQAEAAQSIMALRIVHAGWVLLTFVAVILAQPLFHATSTHHAMTIWAGAAGLHGVGSVLNAGEARNAALLDMLEVAVGLAIVWGLPNTQQILSRFKPSLELTDWDREPISTGWLWSPRLGWALGLGAVFFVSLTFLQDPSSFLYFKF